MNVPKNFFNINLLLFVLILPLVTFCIAGMDHCYVPSGDAQRCLPPFVNAAFGKTVTASDTCGTPPEQFCLQTGVTGVTKSCHMCDSSKPSKRHDASFLTDFNNKEVATWWQSRTMLHEVQYPNMVNLTLHLNKAFDITYVRLLFHTSRPESFAIYKKKCDECDWQPFQYYSGSCFTTYGIDNKEIVTAENEQKPLCTDDYSDISPLTGGNVAFSTLESRPSAYNFDSSPVLQDWVKAVAIRITLNRINTFGDEVFRDPKILKSYYYAISDLSIGGRCTCNGHASECYVGPNDVLQCRCEHNTAGRDCERCADMFNDRPWTRGNRENPGECHACDCSGMSDTCFFDPNLYRQTGRGGHCTNCRGNTDGPHCAYCKPDFYRDASGRCLDCHCDSLGSLKQQCDTDGRCFCKQGVGGDRCDRCLDGYYGLDEAGCRPCYCSSAGSVEGTVCNADSGACVCKLNVEGRRCDRCKPATMNLQESNPYGCTACFCYGHSSVCELSNDYTVAYIVSEFNTGTDGWEGRTVSDQPAHVFFNSETIYMEHSSGEPMYFSAPEKYLGMQRFSYNQFLEFDLYADTQLGSIELGSGSEEVVSALQPTQQDIVLEGQGMRVTASITSQGNPVPSVESQPYKFRLHEAAGFYPRLSALKFQKILNNLTKIYISSSYGAGTVAHLDNVRMKTAERQGAGPKADWVERCDLEGYLGNFTEMCAPGYTRDPPNGGVYAPCVPCSCNGHSATCDPTTGVCDCLHNTMGDNCELCEEGYYYGGDENRKGTPQECQPCPCPDHSSCAVLDDGSVACTNCPPGHAGPQCEVCLDGWFGEPRGRGPCLRCMCNGNIDDNAVMNCNRTTGECLKCIHNTTGFHCDQCLPGYFGKPVTKNAEERCRLCDCNSLGSSHSSMCSAASGQCDCLPNVDGRRCDRCISGYWNLESGVGCESCNCHLIGSSTGECDEASGKCECLEGVAGQRCDRCLPNHYGLSRSGCTACDCNPDGSESLQCDEDGRCSCKEGVFGAKCDRCQENFHDLKNGCRECPTCYSLVQEAVNAHRGELSKMQDLIQNIGEQPLPESNQGDIGFKNDLAALNKTVHELKKKADKKQEEQSVLNERFDEINEKLQGLVVKLAGIEDKVDHCNETVQQAVDENKLSKNETAVIRQALQLANKKLKQAMMDLSEAQKLADDSLSKENNMSKLAEEAEELANEHQALSKNITDTAQEAYDLSRRAQTSIQESIEMMDKLMSSLEELIESENKVPAARQLREDLLAQSGLVKNETEDAKVTSTDLFTEASKLTVPPVDTDAMERRSQDVVSSANDLMPSIDDLFQEYRSNYGELKTMADKAKNSLALADATQNTADMLLARADSALRAGSDAVTRGNSTYTSVLNLVKSLESFDQQITTNRDRAEDALGSSSAIQGKIDDAVTTTAQVKETLGAARKVAVQANEKAQQAMNIAEEVQNSAQAIRSNADDSHARAGQIGEAVSNLSDGLTDTERRLTAAETQSLADKDDVNAVTNAAKVARATATEAERRVTSQLRQLRDLLARLNSTEDVSDDEIGSLEIEYEELRREVEEAKFKATVRHLKKETNEQKKTLRFYSAEIDRLNTDVENLRDIRAAIPKFCSTVAAVEQP